MDKQELLNRFVETYYISPDEAEFIYDEIIKLEGKGRLLELGTGMAHSTMLFSQAMPGWTIYTVDAYGSAGTPPLIKGDGHSLPDVVETWQNIQNTCHKNVIQIVSSFATLPWELPVDVLFIDGAHWYDDIKADWDKYSPFVVKNGLVILHDYNTTFGVKDFIEAEVVSLNQWKIWSKKMIGFLRKL